MSRMGEVVEQYYYDDHAWQVAKDMKVDVSGSEYQMAAEMCRNDGKPRGVADGGGVSAEGRRMG